MAEYGMRVEINTAALQAKYLVSLQRIVDVLTFSLAGVEHVTEERYADFKRFWHFDPAENQRLAFDVAAEEVERWHIKHCLQDAIDVVSAFLEECRMICAFYHLATLKPATGADYKRAVGRDRKAFHQLGLPDKIQHLKELFGVESDWDEHVMSLNRARNCLVHRLGIVREKDVDANGELVLIWKTIRLAVVSADGHSRRPVEGPHRVEADESLELEVATDRKVFRVGDRLVLTYKELLNALFSLVHYVLALPQSIDRYALRVGAVTTLERRTQRVHLADGPNVAEPPSAEPSERNEPLGDGKMTEGGTTAV